jgi:hypothetical protein
MIDNQEISKKYLSDKFLSEYAVTSAHVAKVGFVPSKLKKEFGDKLWGNDEKFGEYIEEYINSLYSLIAKSPHVMEVEPSLEDFHKNYKEGEFGVSVWHMESTLTVDFINLRLVMPKRTRNELGVFKHSWSPEEFNISFNGSLFLTHAPIESVPVFTDLGQIAREYLSNLVKESNVITPFDGVGPTPIHPEFYFIKVKKTDIDVESEIKLPRVRCVGDDVVIIIPEEDDLDGILEPLLRDLEFSISSFYGQRLMDRNLSDLIDNLEELNEDLGGKLAKYFELSLFERFFDKNPKEIRSLLASMHLCLQEISSSQFHVNKKREEAVKTISDSTFLDGIVNYFEEHMEDDNNFDRDAQLTSMNYAADETGNFILTQATLIAALSGALIGGAITSISQYLTGGS